MTTGEQKKRRTMTGTVVSDKMDKTVVVVVESLRKHRLYGKTVRRTKNFKAHDENNTAKQGDRVEIAECRPMSKDKHWAVARVLGTKAVVAAMPEVEDS